MEVVISFFRDTLDGPLYIGVCVFCVINICSCIGYMCEKYLDKKNAKESYDSNHVVASNPVNQTQANQVPSQAVQATKQVQTAAPAGVAQAMAQQAVTTGQVAPAVNSAGVQPGQNQQ